MLTNDKTQIILLHPVRINYDLAKWNTPKHKGFQEGLDTGEKNLSTSDMMMEGGTDFHSPLTEAGVWNGIPFAVRNQLRGGAQRALAMAYIRFRMLFHRPKKNPPQFFMEVKDNFMELQKTKLDDEKIKGTVEMLERTSQKWAIRSLQSEGNLRKVENKLVEAGITQYQTEESMIRFIKKCKKGLCLTEIEYFERMIPEKVAKKMDKAEELKIFDNYYVFHYDPTKAGNIFYEEKDPILFGVIRGSKKMYFIADWVDESCTLTYDDILKSKGATDFKLKKQDESV